MILSDIFHISLKPQRNSSSRMLLIIVVLTLFCHGSYGNDSPVLELDDSNFTSTIAEHEVVLAMFYAPWCIHCQNLKPKFQTAASLLETSDLPVKLVRIDCTSAGKDTCKKYQIEGIPRLKLFRNGKYHTDYKGDREANNIVEFMKAEVGQVAKDVGTFDDLQDMLLSGESVVLGIFKEQSELKKLFTKVASKLYHQYKFAQTTNQDILEDQPIEEGIAIVLATELRNPHEETIKLFNGISSEPELDNFIKQNYYGLVGHRKGKNRINFSFPIVIAYYKRANRTDNAGFLEWRDRIIEVASEYKDNITFAVSPRSMKEYQEFGVLKEDETDVVVARDKRNRKFVYDDDFYKEDFEEFVKNVLGGKLEPYWRSERPPYKNMGPVKIAVAKNFDELVIENPRDCFIGFYAPWCQHCRSLAEKFEELAIMLEEEDVDIIRMDATANDVPHPFKVDEYPTGYWVPKNDKESPIKYVGNSTLEDVLKFIAAHATHELKGFYRNGQPKAKDEL